MCNDNASYYVGYLGYPAISFLMLVNELPFSTIYSQCLNDIHWKDLNQKYHNDFTRTLDHVRTRMIRDNVDMDSFDAFVRSVVDRITSRPFHVLGKKISLPKGY